MKGHAQHIREELTEHLPYTIFSVAGGLIVLGLLTFVATLTDEKAFAEGTHDLFHVFHPLHVLFSATATTAMFWRHERKMAKAIIVGLLGSIGICGISDMAMPYLSGMLLGVSMKLHVCVFEHPMMILPFAVVGIFVGLIVPSETHKSTIASHTGHVLLSSAASILYLVSYGLDHWIHDIGMVFIYMVLAVIVPCCSSDIVFPLLITSGEKPHACGCGHGAHSHSEGAEE